MRALPGHSKHLGSEIDNAIFSTFIGDVNCERNYNSVTTCCYLYICQSVESFNLVNTDVVRGVIATQENTLVLFLGKPWKATLVMRGIPEIIFIF